MINPRNIDKFPHNNIGLPDPWTAIVVRNISKTLQKWVIALSCPVTPGPELCIVNCKLESGLSDNGAGLVILDLAWAHTQPLCCKDHPSQLYFSDFYCTQPRSEITGLVPALPWSDWLLLDLLLVQVSVFLHYHRPAKSETQYLAGRCCPLVSRIQSSCYHRRSWKYSPSDQSGVMNTSASQFSQEF